MEQEEGNVDHHAGARETRRMERAEDEVRRLTRMMEERDALHARELAQRDARLANAEAGLAQRDARLANAEAVNAERDARLANAEAVNAERDAQLNGTFFARIGELWAVEDAQVGGLQVAQAMQRRSYDPINPVLRLSASERTNLPYFTTRLYALDNNYPPANVSSSRPTTQNKDDIWPCNIFGSRRSGDVAHLMPASANHAKTWFMVAAWVLGMDVTSSPTVHLTRAINGTLAPDRQRDGALRRVDYSGLKHSVANRLRILGQNQYLDTEASLLIVPILTVDEAKNWDGGEYFAIVAIDESEDERTPVASVCAGLGFASPNIRMDASEAEVARAKDLLTAVIHGVAASYAVCFPNEEGLTQFTDTLNLSTIIHGERRIRVPGDRVDGNSPVRKIKFVSHNSNDVSWNPAPDPILLAAKAACVWCKRQGRALLAGGLVEDDVSEGDLIAEELFLEARERAHRPLTRYDLARGLHQLNGYEATTSVLCEREDVVGMQVW